MVALDTSGMYWEVYDDQEAKDFDYIGYTDLSGTPVTDKVAANLAAQVAEIKRTNGQRTEVRVYRR